MSFFVTPTEKPRYDASRRLLQYAEFKLQALETAISEHLQAHVVLSADYWPDMFYVNAEIKRPLPDSIGFEVIETVGHLRSALDKIVTEAVDANGRGMSGVGFPFGGLNNGVPDIFPTQRDIDRVAKKLTADQWKIIVDQKPHPGGNDELWAINNIANASKHHPVLIST